MCESAKTDILEILERGESVEAVVFGNYGWDGYAEPTKPLVPKTKRGKVLTWEQAQKYMEGWSFYGGFGAPNCYATYIWTNKRIIWVTQYDGATSLSTAPRHPQEGIPDMPGG